MYISSETSWFRKRSSITKGIQGKSVVDKAVKSLIDRYSLHAFPSYFISHRKNHRVNYIQSANNYSLDPKTLSRIPNKVPLHSKKEHDATSLDSNNPLQLLPFFALQLRRASFLLSIPVPYLRQTRDSQFTSVLCKCISLTRVLPPRRQVGFYIKEESYRSTMVPLRIAAHEPLLAIAFSWLGRALGKRHGRWWWWFPRMRWRYIYELHGPATYLLGGSFTKIYSAVSRGCELLPAERIASAFIRVLLPSSEFPPREHPAA